MVVSSGAIAAGLAGARSCTSLARPILPCCRPSPPWGRPIWSATTTGPSPPTAWSAVRCCWPPSTSSTASSTCTPARPCSVLLGLGVVPVVNENDAIADDEIRFGDNDRLAALVSHLLAADLLRAADRHRRPAHRATPGSTESASLIEEIVAVDHELEAVAGGAGTARGQRRHGVEAGGGQDRRLVGGAGRHRRRATAGGAGGCRGRVARCRHRVRAPGRSVCRPASCGSPSRSGSSGTVVVDEGARTALVERGVSLLPAGVVTVDGAFDADDAVEIAGPDGQVFAKGLTRHSADRVKELAGRRTVRLARGRGPRGRPPRRPGPAAVSAGGLLGGRRRASRTRTALAVVGILTATLGLAGCGGLVGSYVGTQQALRNAGFQSVSVHFHFANSGDRVAANVAVAAPRHRPMSAMWLRWCGRTFSNDSVHSPFRFEVQGAARDGWPAGRTRLSSWSKPSDPRFELEPHHAHRVRRAPRLRRVGRGRAGDRLRGSDRRGGVPPSAPRRVGRGWRRVRGRQRSANVATATRTAGAGMDTTRPDMGAGSPAPGRAPAVPARAPNGTRRTPSTPAGRSAPSASSAPAGRGASSAPAGRSATSAPTGTPSVPASAAVKLAAASRSISSRRRRGLGAANRT